MTEAIFALSTQNTICALHLHRLSGNGVFKLLSPYVFLPQSNQNINLTLLIQNSKHPITRYVVIKNLQAEIIDDVILTLYPNPRSFTGEDTIEISTHGNPIISLQLHSLLRKIGLKDAKPGEFTQRAMLNGKLDLAQAEGINQLIHAESFGAVELARNNVSGVLSEQTLNLRNNLVDILSYLEAHIDFAPDEVGDYHPENLLPQIQNIENKLRSLYSTYENGLKIREGVKIVLCGKPNAGKSSLYNALLKQNKAIVTNIPGTTRDVLEDKLILNNKEFVLLDTAGIRQTTDEIEQIGVLKTFENVKKADIICYLIALPSEISKLNLESIEKEINDFISQSEIKTEDKKILVVFTKKDLVANLPIIPNINLNQLSFSPILISQSDFQALKENLLNLREEIFKNTDTKNSPMLISQRQKDKVQAALEFVEEAQALITIKDFPEKIASVLNAARYSLEEIVGEISVDNVFEKVFSSFCIGK